MRLVRLVVPAAVFAAVLILSGGAAFATYEMSKKEKRPCTTCHTKLGSKGSKDLNDIGKYYKEKKTLEGAPKAE
jgi:hypothetical protein